MRMDVTRYLPRDVYTALSGQYTLKSRLPLLLVDSKGSVVYPGNPCETCTVINLPHHCDEVFRKWRMLVAENSARWGDIYFSTTPLGLVTFAVQLFAGGEPLGALISGFVIFREMRGDFESDLRGGLANLRHTCTVIGPSTGKIRAISRGRMMNHAEFLLRLVTRHNLSDLRLLDEKKERTLQQLNIAHYVEYLKKKKGNVPRSIVDAQDEIIYKAKLGDIKGAKEMLNEYLGYIFFDSGMNFDVLKIRVIELVVLLSRSAIELGASPRELLGINFSYLTELNRLDEFENLCHSLAKILENFIHTVSSLKLKKKKDETLRMLDYIDRHLAERITSRDVARSARLSVSRALHLFKEETGLALTAYIKKSRVDSAKHLLLDTDSPVTQVALESGFYDQSHFTRVFKSLEKMTPSRFRMKYGK